jgi:uncharacterized heparinase superfamily protein
VLVKAHKVKVKVFDAIFIKNVRGLEQTRQIQMMFTASRTQIVDDI